MPKKKNDETIVNRLLSITALVIGLFSLFLAWQANRLALEANAISSRSVKPIVTILNIETVDYIYGSDSRPDPNLGSPNTTCYYAIRITNLGGASTAIIGKKAMIHFKDKQLEVTSNDSIASGYLDSDFSNSFTAETIRNPALVSEESSSADAVLAYPYQLDAYKTEDLYESVQIEWKSDQVEVLSGFAKQLIELGWYELPTGFLPLAISFEYDLSSGETANSLPHTCVFIQAP